MAHKENAAWPYEKRLEAVTTYLVVGKSTTVAALTGVPVGTIGQWKTQDWWKDLADQIQVELDQELDSKLTQQINKSLEVVKDRLENGDFKWDQTEGAFVRIPVVMKDANKVLVDMFDKRNVIRNRPEDRVTQVGVTEILTKLAKEFAAYAKGNTAKVIEGEVVDAKAQPQLSE